MKKAGFLCLAGALSLLLPVGPVAAQQGKVYEVTVTVLNLGFQFCDCFRFSEQSPGCFGPDLLGRQQVYGPTVAPGGWQSTYKVKRGAAGFAGIAGFAEAQCPVDPLQGATGANLSAFGISFHGTVAGESVMGEAIQEIGLLFAFDGFEKPGCSPSTCVVATAAPVANSSLDVKDTWGIGLDR